MAKNHILSPFILPTVLSIAHSIVTSKAAPINFQQRMVFGDENALIHVLDRFEKLQLIRAILQVASFGAMLEALAIWI